LAAFFEDLADSWGGWAGEKSLVSLEGDLDFTAKHDGHVELTVRLSRFTLGDWTVLTKLTIDPGEDLSAAAPGPRACRAGPSRPLAEYPTYAQAVKFVGRFLDPVLEGVITE